MTDRDKRTIRIAALAIAAYLLVFYGVQFWRKGKSGRADYQKLVLEAQNLQQDFLAQQNKALLFEKLSESLKIDPARIKKETLVADASAAIQTAAQQSGMRLGPFRETPGRPNARELSTIQIEGTGPVSAALTLLHKLQTLGFPLVIDTVQLSAPQGGPGGPGRGGPPGMMGGMGGPPMGPGQLKMNVTVTILNYDQFKPGGSRA